MSLDHSPSQQSPRLTLSWLLMSFGVMLIVLDQWIKSWVVHNLPLIDSTSYVYPYGGIGVFRNFLGIEFSINHMTNTGAAWGVLGHYQLPLLVLRIILIIMLITYLTRFNRHLAWQLPLVLITAGAIGNVIDFFVYGHVIDMFHFVFGRFDFPVFNLADSAISIGIILLFFLSWTTQENSKEST